MYMYAEWSHIARCTSSKPDCKSHQRWQQRHRANLRQHCTSIYGHKWVVHYKSTEAEDKTTDDDANGGCNAEDINMHIHVDVAKRAEDNAVCESHA